MTRSEKAKAMAESKARIEAGHAETREIVQRGVCPLCGAGVHLNDSAYGWWQCNRLGAESHRIDKSGESCNWQGFTQ
jgi:hypothetical protein